MGATTISSFFSTDQNKGLIRRFQAILQAIDPAQTGFPGVVPPLKKFFEILEANTEGFDQYCPSNVSWIGNQYLELIAQFSSNRDDAPSHKLAEIFVYSYRFLCELEFSHAKTISFDLRLVKNFAQDNIEQFPPDLRRQLVYASYMMAGDIARRLIQDPAMGDFRQFASVAASAKELKEAWDKEIAEKKIEIEGLRSAIDQIKTQYNFVGLVKGFEALAARTRTERVRSFISLFLIGASMLGVLISEVGFVLLHSSDISSKKEAFLYTVPAITGIELILLYFFRIVLARYRGLQTQLLQLELRISLCQFIQSYSEYASKIKKSDPGALEKFESLIFANVVPDAERLPATFDGVQQLAELIRSLKG